MEGFPRWKYRGSESALVQNEDEEAALGDQWGNVPGFGHGTMGMAAAVIGSPASSRVELLEQAVHRGIKVDRRWSASRIKREIQAHKEM